MSIARAFSTQALENIGVRQRFSEVLLGMVKALGAGVSVMAVVQLAREGSGAVVVSESRDSNTLNILAGICLPAR